MSPRLLRPSSWPIAAKLAFAFCLVALLPIFLASFYNYREGIRRAEESEMRRLADLASLAATNIAYSVADGQRVLHFLLAEFREAPWVQRNGMLLRRQERAVLLGRLHQVRMLNAELRGLSIFDRDGKVLAESGDVFSRRGPLADAATESLVFTVDNRLAVVLTERLLDAQGTAVGIVQLILTPAVLVQTLQSVRSRTAQLPMLIDDRGGVTSPLPLPAGLDKTELVARVRDRKAVEAFPWYGSNGGKEPMGHVGMARVVNTAWTIAVAENDDAWRTPLHDSFMSALLRLGVLIGLAGFVAYAFFTREIIRPLKQLSRVVKAVKQGRHDVHAQVMNDDEIGDLATTMNGMVGEIAKRDRERDVFGRAVTPEVRERLVSGQLKLGGENREVSVLFTDIRDFTTMCEGLGPEQVVKTLNEFLTEMTLAVKVHGGHVNNFLGDGIIVIFGAPVDHPDSVWAAVQASFDMRGRLIALNDRRRGRGEPEISAGIGIGTGTVVAGQMGSLERFVYTVVGDAVNVAARLEALTKDFPDNPILVNDATARRLEGREGVDVRLLGRYALKGRLQELDVYAVDWALF